MFSRIRIQSLSGKILLLSLLPVVLFLALFFLFLLPRFHEYTLKAKSQGAQFVVESTMGILENQVVEVKAGKRTLEYAQTRAKELISTLHFEGKNYLWIQETGPRIVYHPNLALIGKQTDSLEPRMARLFQDLEKSAQAPGGGLFALPMAQTWAGRESFPQSLVRETLRTLGMDSWRRYLYRRCG